jgi:(E)-4-hydroxy-3-methylbut-2-enyl-diphosphate synthase
MLVDRYAIRKGYTFIPQVTHLPYSPVEYKKHETREILNIGGKNHPRVIADFSEKNEMITPANLFSIGYSLNLNTGIWKNNDQAADYIFCGNNIISFPLPQGLSIINDAETWKENKNAFSYPYFSNPQDYILSKEKSEYLNLVSLSIGDIKSSFLDKINNDSSVVWVVETANLHGMAEQRRIFIELLAREINNPVIIKREYVNATADQLRLYAATDAGALLIDGIGEGLWLKAPIAPAIINSVGFGILQATRTRISKTEYISCPSCGRTLFNLQQVTAQIHERTSHLKGVKIGIMGCVVNGPGEMADADYGYVGTGAGKITLYKGKQVVQRNISSDLAVDALITLIKDNGDWVEETVEI